MVEGKEREELRLHEGGANRDLNEKKEQDASFSDVEKHNYLS